MRGGLICHHFPNKGLALTLPGSPGYRGRRGASSDERNVLVAWVTTEEHGLVPAGERTAQDGEARGWGWGRARISPGGARGCACASTGWKWTWGNCGQEYKGKSPQRGPGEKPRVGHQGPGAAWPRERQLLGPAICPEGKAWHLQGCTCTGVARWPPGAFPPGTLWLQPGDHGWPWMPSSQPGSLVPKCAPDLAPLGLGRGEGWRCCSSRDVWRHVQGEARGALPYMYSETGALEMVCAGGCRLVWLPRPLL